jgi:hypothetical protein
MERVHVLIYDILKERDLSHAMLLSAICGVWKTVLLKNITWSGTMIGPVCMIDVIEFVVLKECENNKVRTLFHFTVMGMGTTGCYKKIPCRAPGDQVQSKEINS